MYPQDSIKPDSAPLAQTSIDEYKRTLRLLVKGGDNPTEGIQSKSTARVVKASIRWAISQVDQCKFTNSPLSDELTCVLGKLGGPDNAARLAKGINMNPLKRRVGRVRKLLGLEPNWAFRLVVATENEPPLEHGAVIALYQTGCRISELSRMKLRLCREQLSIVIPGRKLKADSGQELRGLTYPVQGLLTKLAALCPDDSSIIEPFGALSPRRVARVIEKASQATLGAPRRVDSSCLRNNVASICKALGWNPSKIAAALGHQSEGTQKLYGRRVLGSNHVGWVQPIKVLASTVTRPAGSKPFVTETDINLTPSPPK